jgi:glutamyl-Q tRNA(Asp) synthetase
VSYVGRFAPSPTGPLHIGSLATAVASYLHARQAQGSWLVRIEDIDPPREVAGAAADILRTLEAFALDWDGPVVYQSRRRELYEAAAQRLLRDGLAFLCSCTRGELRADHDGAAGPYPGTCRRRAAHARATAVRVRVDDGGAETFVDGLQGPIVTALARTTGDYVVRRRDGLPAYHLAVVIDDAAQGVTAVVRGVDLLDSTAVHLHLQRTLGVGAPEYFHVPVVLAADGQKLSKQTGATPIGGDDPAPIAGDRAASVAARVLGLLGAPPPRELLGAAPRELWSWALASWRIDCLRGRRALNDPTTEGAMGRQAEQD